MCVTAAVVRLPHEALGLLHEVKLFDLLFASYFSSECERERERETKETERETSFFPFPVKANEKATDENVESKAGEEYRKARYRVYVY